jgi:hypothetical protein
LARVPRAQHRDHSKREREETGVLGCGPVHGVEAESGEHEADRADVTEEVDHRDRRHRQQRVRERRVDHRDEEEKRERACRRLVRAVGDRDHEDRQDAPGDEERFAEATEDDLLAWKQVDRQRDHGGDPEQAHDQLAPAAVVPGVERVQDPCRTHQQRQPDPDVDRLDAEADLRSVFDLGMPVLLEGRVDWRVHEFLGRSGRADSPFGVDANGSLAAR